MMCGNRNMHIWTKNDFGTFRIEMECAHKKEKTRKSSVRRNTIQPIIIQSHEDKLRFRGFENEIANFFNLEKGLEREREFRPFDDHVREINQMCFERIHHDLACDNDLARLFFNRQRADE